MKQGMWAGAAAIGVLLALTTTGGAADEDLQGQIDKAIARGVAHLKRTQNGGQWSWSGAGGQQTEEMKMQDVGTTSLAALALLECGTPATDKSIQAAAGAIREKTIKLTYTYSLSLAIMFLDRLGDPYDVALIESMSLRLLAGQGQNGGWGYHCPSISAAEMRRLSNHVKERNELVAKGKLPTAAKKGRTLKDLPEEIKDQLNQIRQGGGGRRLEEDNSNTQFATMALWIARRHGMPTHEALKQVAARFRASQQATGTWAYQASFNQGGLVMMNTGTGTMTCAGLLGLAIGAGAVNEKVNQKLKKERRKPQPISKTDPAIKKGLVALGTCIGDPRAIMGVSVPINGGGGVPQIGNLEQRNERTHYFLWSLERVAMVYGIQTFNKKDWHAWGSKFLIETQKGDGGWHGRHGAAVDTAFSLLFLCRSNLAADLTANLRGKYGESTLTAGGVGGSQLVKGTKSINSKPEKSPRKDSRPAANRDGGKPRVEDQATQIARLSKELVQASGKKRADLLARLRDTSGLVYTEALANSIPMLDGADQEKARVALADRLTRLKANSLRDKFQDDNVEVRRAAVQACLKKKSKQHVSDLIVLIEDSALPVAQAAHKALKELTGKDFGPEADATRAERRKAVAQWKAWWKQQSKE
jgi:hypothetical protein